ncbi:Signal transduction histidine-protein kinase BarA [Amantichitinum ursilacus]|uniref:Virulence sensor protein BvgS n=2 Tax=Amantichitinum ursilacus TaxID=857265 RepID=A0A0N0XI57_9NEIS|nr:Signal transduction histidine-protein kinase BarA [Amantichitinum ursilacus]
MRTGNATMTGPLSLVQKQRDKGQSFLLLLPVYRTVSGITPSTLKEREEQLTGWTFAALSRGPLLSGVGHNLADLRMVIQDATETPKSLPFFDNRAAGELLPLHCWVERSFYGRHWRIGLFATPEFAARLHLPDPELVLLGGLGLSVLLSALVLSLSIGLARRHLLAVERARMSAIIEDSEDGIIAKTLGGVVLSWNRGATQIFGYLAEEAIGKPLTELIIPPDLWHEEAEVLARVTRGEHVPHFDTRRYRKDGEMIDVSVTVSPIRNEGGAIVGASKTVRDITAQKSAESQIRRFNTRLEAEVEQRTAELESTQRAWRTVLDAVPSMIGYWDAHLVNRVANRAYHEWYGMPDGYMEGRALPDILGPARFEQYRPRIEAALCGNLQSFELDVFHDSKGVRRLLVQYLPDTLDGSTVGFYVLATDVSELADNRNRLAAALAERQLLLETINTHLLYLVTDSKGNITEVNEKFCEATGYASQELLGVNFRALPWSDESRGRWRTIIGELLGRRVWRGEISAFSRKGGKIWIETVIAADAGQGGGDQQYVAVGVDVTKAHEASREASRLGVMLQNVLRAASGISIIATDRDGVIQMFNEGACRLLGCAAEDVLGRRSIASFHAAGELEHHALEIEASEGISLTEFECLIHGVDTKGSQTHDWTYVDASGGQVPVSVTMSSIVDSESGSIQGYLAVGVDIRAQRAFERKLIQARNAAEEASVAKSRFMANMSHEIRTPLNAVIGLLQLLMQAVVDERQRDHVVKAHGAALSLLELLNDILDFAKIEAGKLELDLGSFEVEQLFRELGTILSGNQGSKPVEILFEIDGSVPPILIGDRVRLKQVLLNIGGNALKFTERGHIIIRLRAIEVTALTAHVCFSIEDTGIGIARENIERIFEGFTQAEASTSRRFGGTGLGLAISRRLVRLMGGNLQLSSELGRGSTFSFNVRFGISKRNALLGKPFVLQSLNILIVDDRHESGEILEAALNGTGWHVDYVDSPFTAMDALYRAEQLGKAYDVVVMDWRMPELDGLSTARYIRSQSAQAPAVIIVSAYGREELAAALEEPNAPMVEVLSKPVTPGQLIEAIHKAAGENVRGEAGAGPGVVDITPERLAGVHILVVEDNELNRLVASELLRLEGAIVYLAEGGLSGVEHATANPALYDVILMDVQMPDIDGLEATRRIRANEATKGVPIMAMTANVSEEDIRKCLDAGMDGHIGKPIDMDELVGAVRRVTKVEVGQNMATSEEEAPIAEPVGVLLNRFAGRSEVLKAGAHAFGPECFRLLDSLEHATEPDHQAATFHALKGMAGTMGALKLAAVAKRFEGQVRRTGLDATDVAGLRALAAETADHLLRYAAEL